MTFTVLAALTPRAAAQRTAGGRASAPGHTAISHSPAGHSRFRRSAHAPAFRRSSPYASSFGSLPFPFFGDSFDPDDIYSTGYPVASDPPPFLMQAVQQLAGSGPASMGQAMGQAMNAPANYQPSSTDPLMIELQNGRYVRVNSVAANREAEPLKLSPNHSRASSTPPPMITASPSQPLPPAVLIFRDGHSEEVRDYTIADGVLYARGDYYTDGYWNKKIDLTSLNVPETLQANNQRNVKFVLPSFPNEVITRP
ncbi:MAG: hypothetical protein WCF74_04605 [Candidatus Sulfotelmatobacter sp.]